MQKLIESIEQWIDSKKHLEEAKRTELDLRKDIVNRILNHRDESEYGEAEKAECRVGPYSVKAGTTELMSIDSDGLLSYMQNSQPTAEEINAVQIKASITRAKLDKLSVDSEVRDFVTIKPSPTPTLTVTEN